MEVGFALFRLRPTPCPSGIPLPREGGWYEMIGISTLSRCQSKSGLPHRSPPILPASIKLATPISNGGLFGTPPGFCTDTCLWQV